MFWEKATKWGAIASIVSGTVVALVWEEIGFIKGSLPASLADLDAVLPAITISVAALFIVSLLTPPSPREKWEPFFTKDAD